MLLRLFWHAPDLMLCAVWHSTFGSEARAKELIKMAQTRAGT